MRIDTNEYTSIKKKANKHKKLFENKVMINPYGYEVNGVSYFLVIYKKGDKHRGYTVIAKRNTLKLMQF